MFVKAFEGVVVSNAQPTENFFFCLAYVDGRRRTVFSGIVTDYFAQLAGR